MSRKPNYPSNIDIQERVRSAAELYALVCKINAHTKKYAPKGSILRIVKISKKIGCATVQIREREEIIELSQLVMRILLGKVCVSNVSVLKEYIEFSWLTRYEG